MTRLHPCRDRLPHRGRIAFLAATLGLLVCVTPGVARADEPRAGPEPEVPAPKVYWHEEWSRFSVGELLISAAVTVRNSDIGNALDGPNSATIKFKVPVLDEGARSLFRGNASQQIAAARLSDIGLKSIALAPYVVDVGFGTLALHRSYDVALQLALIDFEVLTLAGFTQILVSRTIGRARPYVEECPPEGCSGGPYRSFLSGHSMATFAAAGLMCRHHQELPLFGGGAPDLWACIWALSAASATGTLRLVADQHWASDVLLGAGTGFVYGYYLPKLLHFHAKKLVAKTKMGSNDGFSWMPTATAAPTGATIGFAAVF